MDGNCYMICDISGTTKTAERWLINLFALCFQECLKSAIASKKNLDRRKLER